MHNGTNITGDVTFSPNKNDLKIQNAQLTHNGVYTCIATADGLTDNQDISLIIVPGKVAYMLYVMVTMLKLGHHTLLTWL